MNYDSSGGTVDDCVLELYRCSICGEYMIKECGGGMCAVAGGKVLALVPLPIAGLISDRKVEEVAALVSALDSAWREMGCVLNSPYMTMAIVPLACLPELRLTNRGLVDCRTFQFVDLFT